MSNLKKLMPWWAKIAFKVGLSRLPIPYRIWKGLGLFENGPMEQGDYALNVFKRHFELCGSPRNFTCLELGPGDSLSSAIIGLKQGAARVYLVDVGDFASRDLRGYKSLAGQLGGADFQNQIDWTTRESMLSSCRAEYLTRGVESLKLVPSNSCDYIWSHAVLEHVRRKDFGVLLEQFYRILKPSGCSSHVVDLRDHLGNSLNNLRFTDNVWESQFLSSSGFYTNRIRYSEMLALFKDAGFSTRVVATDEWKQVPLARSRMASNFQHLSDDELRVAGFTVVLTPKGTLR